MKRALLALVVVGLLVASTAIAGDATVQVTEANTAGAVLVEIDGIPQSVMFVSLKGQIAVVPIDQCKADPECSELGYELAQAHKVEVLNLRAPQKV